MYLKEIQLSGFKSFADKTNINLFNNITCIVGPNGSGKSNIVDAVKWVMGEQSVKTLRGTSGMTDVIFSGSKTRDPLSLAAVTLVFDNSDSYLKVPYTEVSVTRKVFKTGENEYLLNNEKCRLKDIQDLFLDTGMGKSSFNIISQGEIEKLISNSPYDRRVVFEEVAGVLKYKKRKEEALKKLDKTNNNLARVKDIINELEVQLEPLKEQSIRAKDYLENKKKLESVEIALLAHDIEMINNEYSTTKDEIEHLQDELVKITTTNTNDDVLVTEKKEKLQELQDSLTELNENLLFLTKEEERLNGDKNIIQERSKYNAKDQKVYENISNLKETKLRLENELDSVKKEVLVFEKEKEVLLGKKEAKDNEVSLLTNEKNKLVISVNDKKQTLTSLEYRAKALSDYIEQGGNVNPNVKRIMNNPKLRGIHDTIIGLIDIKEEYTLALEVALGGAKDYLVVDNPAVAKECINFLKDNNLGRVTFYPLDVIKPRSIDDDTLKVIKNDTGFIDILSNLIEYDSKYSNVIKNQLGNVILVNEIDDANRIAKLINNRYKIVTLSGEIINVGGSITGGTIKTSRSIISERYELDKINLDINNIKEEIDKLLEKVKAVDKDILDKTEDLKEIELNLLKQDEKIGVKNNSRSLINTKYGLILKELQDLSSLVNDTVSEEENRIVEKYYNVVNSKNDLLKQISLVTTSKDNLVNEISHLEANYRYNNSVIRDYETKLKELEISISKKDVKLDNMLNILSESYNLTFEKAKADYILEQDEKEARKQVNLYRTNLKNIGIVNLGAIEEYERINTRYTFLSKQKDDLTKAITMLLQIIDNLDRVMKDEFMKSFKEIEVEFGKVFEDIFKGGSATLKLMEPDNVLESGIDIIVSPPGKKLSTISLLSGGEKSLTAICLLFAILNVRKVPFCLFDEVEAALDEANVEVFGNYLNKYKDVTQFLIITHKKKTMEFANNLYGITMQESGVSKLVSVKLVE